jgi:serine/threonine protein kinase
MSAPTLSQQTTHPNSVHSLQLALQPLVQYEERLKSIADLGQSALLSHIEARELRSLCGRVKKLDIPAMATHLSEVKAAGALSSREAQVLSSLETLVNQAATHENGKKSCNLMIQNLNLVLSTFDALPRTTHEGTRLSFPEAAASLALFVLRRDGTYTKESRGLLGEGSFGSVTEISVAGSTYAEKRVCEISDRKALHSGAAKAYQIASKHFVRIAAVTNKTVVMEKGTMTLGRALNEDRASHIPHFPGYIREMLQGLFDTHKAGFVMRDIKKSNMVLVPGDLPSHPWKIKYIDYDPLVPIGSRAIPTCSPYHHSPQLAKIDIDFSKDDPELPLVDPADDAWALGVAIFQTLSGPENRWFKKPPGHDALATYATATSLTQEHVEAAISAIDANEELKTSLGDQLGYLTTTLRILLDFDPKKRATAVERALTYLSEMQDADLPLLRLSTSSATLVDSAIASDRSPIDSSSPARSSDIAGYTGLRMEDERVLSVHPLESPPAAQLPVASPSGQFSSELGIASASPRSEVPHLGAAVLPPLANRARIDYLAPLPRTVDHLPQLGSAPSLPVTSRARQAEARLPQVAQVPATSSSGQAIRLSAAALAIQEARNAAK